MILEDCAVLEAMALYPADNVHQVIELEQPRSAKLR